MAISYVGSVASTSASITEPAHLAGDVLVLVAINDGSNTAPTSPGNGYSVFWDNTANLIGGIFAVRLGDGTPRSLTTANATNQVISVYRGSVDPLTVLTANLRDSDIGTSARNINFGLAGTTSWVVTAKATREDAATASAQTPVAGTTHRVTSGGTAELSIFDTNGAAGVTSWAPAAQTISTTSTGWMTIGLELIPLGVTDVWTVDSGSLSITGQTVGIVNTVPVTPASLAFTGQSIGLLDALVDISTLVMFASGEAVNYVDTTGITPAALTLTGQAITHAIAGGSYIFDVDPATITVFGSDVDNTDGILIESTTITVTGYGVTGEIRTPPPAPPVGAVAHLSAGPRKPMAGDDGVLTLQQILDRAFKQCRVVPQNISGEMMKTGIEVLQDMLDALPARTAPLWARDYQTIGILPDARAQVMPSASIEVIDMRRREWRERLTGPLIDYGNKQTMELNGREEIHVVGVMFLFPAYYDFTIETSLDGTEYTAFRTLTGQYFEAGRMYWFEADPLLRVNYVRLNGIEREWLAELYLGQDPYDVDMDRLNQQNFNLLPPSRQGPPTQFWVDRQASEPVIMLWPRPDVGSTYHALHVFRQRHVNISTRLRDAIEIPRRWKEAFISMLAYRIALNTPQIDLAVIPQLKPLADEMTMLIAAVENDPAPITVNVGIRGYTR